MGDVHVPIQPFGVLQRRSLRLLCPGSVPEASMTLLCLLVATEMVTMAQYLLVDHCAHPAAADSFFLPPTRLLVITTFTTIGKLVLCPLLG